MSELRRIRTTFAALLTVVAMASCDSPLGPLETARPGASMSEADDNGPIILRHPEQSPGAPYYGHFGRGFLPNNGEWAGLPFYRAPECVPATFNLLDQFDPPAAFGCPLRVQGKEWWHDLSDPFPFQVFDRARETVPIFFVRWSELQEATADDVLTIGELRGLPSLRIGEARVLTHLVQNTNQPRDFGREVFSARGTIKGGGSFQFRYEEKFVPTTGEHIFPYVVIRFERPDSCRFERERASCGSV